MRIYLSKTSKMPGYSFSLPAGESCGEISNIAEKCKGCYAKRGRYKFPNVYNPRKANLENLLQHPDKFAKQLGATIGYVSKEVPYFRFFDSGDFLNETVARVVLEAVNIAVGINKNIKFWIPTTQWYRPELAEYFKELIKIQNVTLRPSLFEILREDSTLNSLATLKATGIDFPAPCVVTTIKDPEKVKKLGFHLCEATYLRSECGTCRKCWEDKETPVAYVKH